VIAAVLAGCGSAIHDDKSATFEFGGLSRTYLLHVPPGRPTALVVNLPAVADADGFVVVYPNGIETNTGPTVAKSEPERRGAWSLTSGP
jgi:polyhydroxybutyrate depolymerase